MTVGGGGSEWNSEMATLSFDSSGGSSVLSSHLDFFIYPEQVTKPKMSKSEVAMAMGIVWFIDLSTTICATVLATEFVL